MTSVSENLLWESLVRKARWNLGGRSHMGLQYRHSVIGEEARGSVETEVVQRSLRNVPVETLSVDSRAVESNQTVRRASNEK
jgi:hypothetical protein